jgi:hypothetical protein
LPHPAHRSGSLGRQLTRLATAQLDKGRAALRPGEPPLDAQVHVARTTIKKTRALLRLVRPGRHGARARRRAKRVSRTLARLARRMAPLRDAAVVITTFDRLTAGMSPDWQPFLRGFRAQLGAIWTRRARRFERHETARRGRARFARARERVVRWRPRGDLRRAISEGLEAGYGRARRAMLRALALPRDPGDAIHAWRRASKAHRHHIQLLLTELGPFAASKTSLHSSRPDATAAPEGDSRPADLAAPAALAEPAEPADFADPAPLADLGSRLLAVEQLDDRLGEEHDLTFLEETIERHRRHFPEPKARLHVLRALEHRRRVLREEAAALGRRLYANGPRTFARTLGPDPFTLGAESDAEPHRRPRRRGRRQGEAADSVGRLEGKDLTSASTRATSAGDSPDSTKAASRSRSMSTAV